MKNDVNTLETGGVKAATLAPGETTHTITEYTLNNRDQIKVIHFNQTTAPPPSHYPMGLLYLSTFSFSSFFFGLGWWQGKLLCGTSALEESDDRKRYFYIL